MIDRVVLHFGPHDLPASKKSGDPILPRKNVYFATTRGGGIHLTPEARAFRKMMAAKCRQQGFLVGGPEAVIRDGWWRLELLTIAGRRNTTRDVLLPCVDSDACLSPVKDALVKCCYVGKRELPGLIDGDDRIIGDSTHDAWREGEPGLVIRLRRVEDPQVELAASWGSTVRFLQPRE